MKIDPRWRAVAVAIETRMAALGLSQADLIRESGVSDFTVRKLMRAEQGSYRAAVLHKVCRALGWSADSIDRMLVGRQPEYVSQPVDGRPGELQALIALVEELSGRLAQLQAQVAELAVLAAPRPKRQAPQRGAQSKRGSS